MKIFMAIAGLVLGAFAMVFGEFDDSPGLQGLGMILIFFIIYRIYRSFKNSRLL